MAEQIHRDELEPEQLHERLNELERRVAVLEMQREARTNAAVETFLGAQPKENEKQTGPTSVVPVLGKGILAIAGAYLLRAIAESGAAPRWIMLVVGILYASAWLVWAVRSHRNSHFASVVFGLTAATILPPLLWEGTVRFQALSAGFASTVLVGAVALSLALAWNEKLEAIPWIGTVAAVGTAMVLIVATHELRALTTALLVMALLTEAAACFGRWLNLRTVTALAADLAVSLLALVMTSAEGVPESYRAMSANDLNAYCVALIVIYGGSVAIRGFILEKTLTFTEVGQAVVAFTLAMWVSLRATHGGSASVLGPVFLVFGAVCYWGALRRFTGIDMRRNRRVSTTYAAALILAGSFLLLKGDLLAVGLSMAAVASVAGFLRTRYLTLGIHGTFYLLAAGMVCGLFGYAGNAFAGTVPSMPQWSFWTVALTGLVIYLMGSGATGEGWRARALWVVPSTVVTSAAAALAIAGITGLRVGELNASRLSMVRTVVTCVVALGLGYLGSRRNRVELGWLAYGAIGLGGLKLLVEDLRYGNAATLMVSLLFYGLILILLPRLTRFGRVEV